MRALLLALSLTLLGACAPLYVPPEPAPAPSPPTPAATNAGMTPPVDSSAPPVQILPVSSHVSGLPYSAHCVAPVVAGGTLPDHTCTPGAASSAVTQGNIHTTICVSGYTAKIRPSASETGAVKKAAMRSYGEASSASTNTELDHLVPLELGGSNDVSNLWPEPSDEPGQGFRNTKDTVENDLRSALCHAGSTLRLTDLQSWIAADWTTAEHKAGLN